MKVVPSRDSVRWKRSPALCSRASPTIPEGPDATVSAQELIMKKRATKPMARNITRATTMCGRRVSSA